MSEGNGEQLPRGLLYCFLTVVVAVSLVGFFTGTAVDHSEFHHPHTQLPEATPGGEVEQARSYSEMGRLPREPQSGWEEGVRLSPQEVFEKLDEKSLEKTLKERARRRAYEGAPPTIPHAVRQNSASECMACHGEGLRLGRRYAQTLPHDNFTSCTQCHVSESPPMPGSAGPDPRAVGNSFVGLQAPRQAERASPVAPPQIPHQTFMRENCMSCHGPLGANALRTSHPSRQSCTQCHASSATLDQRPGVHP